MAITDVTDDGNGNFIVTEDGETYVVPNDPKNKDYARITDWIDDNSLTAHDPVVPPASLDLALQKALVDNTVLTQVQIDDARDAL